MCNCASCEVTDYPVDRPFADWPKGNRPPSTVYGRAKIPKDKAYTAHWAHCGNGLAFAPIEQKKTRVKPDIRQYALKYAGGWIDNERQFKLSSAPAPVKFPHTRLNQSGWRERMIALNAGAIGKEANSGENHAL